MPSSADREPQSLPRYWRIPPWQPAALILAAAVLFGLAIYANLAPGPIIACCLVGAAFLFGALVATRFLMVADEEGIWVRRVIAVQLVEWKHIADIELTVGKHNAATVRITRHNGTYVDVPPTLILPSRPTSIPKVRSIIAAVAMDLTELAKQQQTRRR